MRKLVVAAALVLTLAACDEGAAPKPKKTAVIAAEAVRLCVDPAMLVRAKDAVCEAQQDGFRWLYVEDRPTWTKELPAVGESIQFGRGVWEPPKVGMANVPEEGAFFD